MAGRRNVVRNSFAMGELSPRMLGRSDLRGTYQQGLRRLVNFLVDKTGSAKYRAGTQHARQIGAAGDHRLIPLKIAGNPALLHLTTTQARVYYAAAPTAGFDLLSAASAAVTISLTAPQLRDLQWVQRPFNAIVAEGWYHQDDEDYTSLTAAGNTDPRGITSDGTYTWIADITAGKLFAYDAVERTAVAAKNFELTRDGLPGGDAITNHDRPIGCWTNGEHMFVSFERIDDYIAAYRMGDMAYDEAANIDSLVGGDNTAIRSLEGDATYLYVADEDDARIYAYTLADGERAPAQYYNTLRAAGCTNPIGLWLSESHMFVLHRNGTDRQIFAFDRESKAHDPDVDVPTIVASNANPFDIIGSAEFFWVTDRVADKVFAYAQPSPQDPEAAVYLFHPDIEPILLQWDSNGNALAAPRTSNVIADPPVVGQQPAAGAFFEQRLVVAGGNKNPQSIAGSRTPDPDTGRPRYTDWLLTTETGSVIDEEFHSVQTVLATNAFAYTLFSEVAVRVRWMVSKDEVVVIGCDEAIYLARELAPDTPPIIRDHTVTGAGLVRPAVAPFGVCYASADRRRVYEIISQRELTAHSDALFEDDRIAELTWTKTPVERLWVRTDSGKVMTLAVKHENGVLGWSRLDFGAGTRVRSIARGAGGDEGDTLWLAIERGSSVHLEALREPTDRAHADRVYLDSSRQARTGLGHLNGVAGLMAAKVGTDANQKQEVAPATVAGGTVTTALTGTVRVGIPYTADLQPPQIAVDVGGEGAAFSEGQRVSRATLGVFRSFGGKIGPTFDLLSDLSDPVQVLLYGIEPDDITLDPKQLRPKTSDKEALVAFRQDQPQPFNILFIEMEVGS